MSEHTTLTKVAIIKELVAYPCACRSCYGVEVQTIALVAWHNHKYGRDPYPPSPILVSVSLSMYVQFLLLIV